MKLLKNILYCFIYTTTMTLTTSCDTPSSTNWLFVNQTEVDKLLSSPEEVEIEGNKYKLISYFREESYHIGRGCIPFTCNQSRVTSPRVFSFFLIDSKSNNNIELKKTIKINSLWVINKSTKFYFENNKISFDINDSSFGGSITASNDYVRNHENIGILKLESKNKIFYIKSQMT